MRPALRRDWTAAIGAFDSVDYTNELGVTARADRLDAVARDLDAVGMTIVAWYGVRVFNDDVAPEAAAPNGEDLELLLDAEDLAGRRDPYR